MRIICGSPLSDAICVGLRASCSSSVISWASSTTTMSYVVPRPPPLLVERVKNSMQPPFTRSMASKPRARDTSAIMDRSSSSPSKIASISLNILCVVFEWCAE